MPRRYHRPPGAKRRKPKKTSIPYAFEAAAEPEGNGLPMPDAGFDDDAFEEDAEYEEPLAVASVSRGSAAAGPVRHIQHDYSYVRAEVLRILAVAVFLITSLLITAVLRN